MVELFRLFRRIADRHHAETPVFADRGEHVDNDAGLLRLVKMEAVPDQDVDELLRRDRAIQRIFQMIAGDVVLLRPAWRPEDAFFLIERAIGNELKKQERVRVVPPLRRLISIA